MGRFDPYLEVYRQNDEVSPDVHHPYTAKCAPDTPTVTRSKLLLGDGSSSGLARARYGILNGSVFRRFTPDYD